LSKRLIAAFAGVVAIAAILAGCGSSNDSSSGSTQSTAGTAAPTKAEFIKQADAICEKANKGTEAEFAAYVKKLNLPPNKKPTTAQQEELITAVALPAIAAQAKELGELSPPSGEEGKVNAIVEGIAKAVEKTEANPSTVFGRRGPFAEVNKLAKDYGFTVCGQ
jgi:hypothetical protein